MDAEGVGVEEPLAKGRYGLLQCEVVGRCCLPGLALPDGVLLVDGLFKLRVLLVDCFPASVASGTRLRLVLSQHCGDHLSVVPRIREAAGSRKAGGMLCSGEASAWVPLRNAKISDTGYREKN